MNEFYNDVYGQQETLVVNIKLLIYHDPNIYSYH